MASKDSKLPAERSVSVEQNDERKGEIGGGELTPQSTIDQPLLEDTLEPHESYEGKHRWDPSATWDPKEEAAVIRKTDLYLLTWICVMFFGLQLGRSQAQKIKLELKTLADAVSRSR